MAEKKYNTLAHTSEPDQAAAYATHILKGISPDALVYIAECKSPDFLIYLAQQYVNEHPNLWSRVDVVRDHIERDEKKYRSAAESAKQ